MSNKKLMVTQPAPLSIEAIERPIAMGNEMMIVWCPLSKFGGLYFFDKALWHTIGPLDDLDAFKRFLANSFPEAVAVQH